jgi:NADPH-dependent 2,4-dienoyl-CoA reductase/sulfur reductase-like enzyme
MTAEHIAIVGAGLAGLRTAERLRRAGYDGKVTLVGGEQYAPYDRPPMSKGLLLQEDEPGAAHLCDADALSELELDLRLGVRAVRLDTTGRTLELDDGSTLSWDRLVIATGARARTVPAWEGFTNVHVLRTFDDCVALRTGLRAARHVTVVGAGVLGGEIAASARHLGVEVTLVESLSQPLVRVLGRQLGAAVADLHLAHGVDLRLGVQVTSLDGSERVERVLLSDGSGVPTELVVLAVGSLADTDWLEGSGIEVADGVLCDASGATSAEGVYAVGDVARMPRPGCSESLRLEHWTSAGDTASLVAHNLLADPSEARTLREVPYFWSDHYDVKIQALGAPTEEDDVEVVAGSVADHKFLALCTRDGRVTAAVGMRMPAPLARCRPLVGSGATLAEALDRAPWAPKQKVAS